MAICKMPYNEDSIITFSDEGWKIRKVGRCNNALYCYAVDAKDSEYEYEEADELVEHTAMQVWQMETLGVKYWIPSMANVKVKYNYEHDKTQHNRHSLQGRG